MRIAEERDDQNEKENENENEERSGIEMFFFEILSMPRPPLPIKHQPSTCSRETKEEGKEKLKTQSESKLFIE